MPFSETAGRQCGGETLTYDFRHVAVTYTDLDFLLLSKHAITERAQVKFAYSRIFVETQK